MKSLRNSVTLIGHLGKDPEVKVYANRKKASFSIATTDTYKNQKGDKVQDTQWHNIVIWGALAGVAEKYLKKGQEVVVEGKLVHRVYEATGGEKKFFTEVSVNDLVMLGKKNAQ
jgi:single-strand DNA-binding protein